MDPLISSSSATTKPVSAQAVPAGNAGDDLLAGMDKLWTRAERARKEPFEWPSGTERTQGETSSPLVGRSSSPARTFEPVPDDYELHLEGLGASEPQNLERGFAAVAEQVRRNEAIDAGLTAVETTSKVGHGLQSSIKTLVTGQ